MFSFLFLYRNCRCYDFFFTESVILKVLDHSYVQSSQQLQGTLTTAFERHFIIEDFTDVDQHMSRAYINTLDLILYASLSFEQT